jgi:tetratricopeptide (TPR) repeat protein
MALFFATNFSTGEKNEQMFWEQDNAVPQIELLAAQHREAGNTAQAKSLYTCLIAMIKRDGGEDSEQLAVTFYRLAETYSDEGNYKAAQIYYRRAVEIWEKIHPDPDSAEALAYERALQRMQGIMEAEDEQRDRNQGRHEGAA